MATLTWMQPTGDHVVQLRSEQRLGRHPANAIQILDALVSKSHAEIVQVGKGWILRDLGSLNGTWVNGVRVVGERKLQHLDQVTLGGTTLLFSDLAEAMHQVGEGRAGGPGGAAATPSASLELDEPTVFSEEPPPVSVRIPRDVSVRLAQHERFLRALQHAYAESDVGALVAQALEDVVDLVEARWGAAFFAPFTSDKQPTCVALRSALSDQDVSLDLALVRDAEARGGVVLRSVPEGVGYRVWRPTCRCLLPLRAKGRTLALLELEIESTPESVPVDMLSVLARVLGGRLDAPGEARQVH